MDVSQVVSITKELTQSLAFIAGGIFFTVKIFQGYRFPNLSVSVSCERYSGDEYDTIVIKVFLEKGAQGTLQIYDCQACITPENEEPIYVKFVGTRRLRGRDEKVSKAENRKSLSLEWETDRRNPFINLTPGEKTEFSCHKSVAKGKICQVEIAILGKRLYVSALEY